MYVRTEDYNMEWEQGSGSVFSVILFFLWCQTVPMIHYHNTLGRNVEDAFLYTASRWGNKMPQYNLLI